jgi:plasmid stability protein
VSDVPALHIRNVPTDVLEALRRRAKRNGRSLNTEVLRVLAEHAESEHEGAPITARLAEIARRINLPPDAPKPEEFIRADRDSH